MTQTPIAMPIMLIHGFNGSPRNWTGPEDLFPEFLAAHGYDPSLIRVFNYGYDIYKGKRYYNNLGDIRQIAHRLDEDASSDPDLLQCSVDRLSRDSVARGGAPQVTIIAHSSGGLVARYYLSRKTEDEFGTLYRGRVGQVIFLGTPHQGVDVEDILDPLPNHWIYDLMVRLHYLLPPEFHEHTQSLRAKIQNLHASRKQAWAQDQDTGQKTEETPTFKQIHPHSEFLNEINRMGAMPADVSYFNIFGDIRLGVRVQFGHRTLVDGERDFGDFLVTTMSAGTIPNARSDPFAIAEEYSLDIDTSKKIRPLVEVQATQDGPTPIHRWLRGHPASRKRILEILANSAGAGTVQPVQTGKTLPLQKA